MKIQNATIPDKISRFTEMKLTHSHLVEWDDFMNLLKQGDKSSLKDFLSQKSKENKLWNEVKELFLLPTESGMDEDITRIDSDFISEIIKTANLYASFKQGVQSGNLFSSDSSDSEYRNSEESSTRLDISYSTRSKTNIASQVIRGEVRTYAKSMMGGFRYCLKDFAGENGEVVGVSMYIDENAVITRPKDIVGNLGRTMGDHVVPIALVISEISSATKGKQVFEAIQILQDIIAGDMTAGNVNTAAVDRYQNIIDQAKPYLNNYKRDLEAELRAFSFLHDEFIPSIVAIHNQFPGTAFYGKKTQTELLKDARSVKSFLAKSRGEITEDIKNFIHEIDYSPVVNPAQLSAEESRSRGKRTNHIDALSDIMGDVVDTFFCLYGIDAKDSLDVTTELVKELLKEKGWVDYYSDSAHQTDLGDGFKNNSSILINSLSNHIVGYIKANRSMLTVDNESFHDSSSQTSKNRDSDGSDIEGELDVNLKSNIEDNTKEDSNLERFKELSIGLHQSKKKPTKAKGLGYSEELSESNYSIAEQKIETYSENVMLPLESAHIGKLKKRVPSTQVHNDIGDVEGIRNALQERKLRSGAATKNIDSKPQLPKKTGKSGRS